MSFRSVWPVQKGMQKGQAPTSFAPEYCFSLPGKAVNNSARKYLPHVTLFRHLTYASKTYCLKSEVASFYRRYQRVKSRKVLALSPRRSPPRPHPPALRFSTAAHPPSTSPAHRTPCRLVNIVLRLYGQVPIINHQVYSMRCSRSPRPPPPPPPALQLPPRSSSCASPSRIQFPSQPPSPPLPGDPESPSLSPAVLSPGGTSAAAATAADTAATTAASAAVGLTEWACKECTFLNDGQFSNCNMCGASSASAPAAASAAADAATADTAGQTEQACGACTFLNDHRVSRCALCGALMPREGRPSDRTSRDTLIGNSRGGDLLSQRERQQPAGAASGNAAPAGTGVFRVGHGPERPVRQRRMAFSLTRRERPLAAARDAEWLQLTQHMREMGFSDAVVLEVVQGMAAGIVGEGQEGSGPRPASATAIAALPEETLGASSLARLADKDDARLCCICLDEFGAKEVVTRLPCAHLYHAACIKKWLHTCGSCPQCKQRVV